MCLYEPPSIKFPEEVVADKWNDTFLRNWRCRARRPQSWYSSLVVDPRPAFKKQSSNGGWSSWIKKIMLHWAVGSWKLDPQKANQVFQRGSVSNIHGPLLAKKPMQCMRKHIQASVLVVRWKQMAEVLVIYRLYLLRTSAFKPSLLRLVLNQNELQKTWIKGHKLGTHFGTPTNPNTFVLLHIDVTKPWPPKLHPSGIHMAGRHSIFQVETSLKKFKTRQVSWQGEIFDPMALEGSGSLPYSRHVWAALTASAVGCGYHRSLRSLKLLWTEECLNHTEKYWFTWLSAADFRYPSKYTHVLYVQTDTRGTAC